MYKYINFQQIFEDMAVQQTTDQLASTQETVTLDLSIPTADLANLKQYSSATPYVAYAINPLSTDAKKSSKTVKVYYDSTPEAVSSQAEQPSDSYYLPLSDLDIQNLQNGQPLANLALRAPSDPTQSAIVNSPSGLLPVMVNVTQAQQVAQQPMQPEAPMQADQYAQADPYMQDEETYAEPTQAELTPGMPTESLISSFSNFVSISEAKKKELIKDIKMKKGALKKELGDTKLTFADLEKAGAKLKKKDKDPKKKGLQLNKKDATLQKRLTLAKNLMKVANESLLTESKKSQISAIKNQLVEIHKIIEDAIKKTTRK